MFQPEPVERDKYGFWLHTALHKLGEDRPVTDLPEAEGMEFRFISFEADAPDELQRRYEQGCSIRIPADDDWIAAVKDWQPPKPKGDCWFLLSIYDTEDGPYACFTRPKGRHRLKLKDFDEGTGEGTWACRCGREVKRTAKFMCVVPGAAEEVGGDES